MHALRGGAHFRAGAAADPCWTRATAVSSRQRRSYRAGECAQFCSGSSNVGAGARPRRRVTNSADQSLAALFQHALWSLSSTFQPSGSGTADTTLKPLGAIRRIPSRSADVQRQGPDAPRPRRASASSEFWLTP